MQSPWRVACVRIPRFPIGAVLRQDAEARAREAASQLALPLEGGPRRDATRQAPPRRARPRSPTGDTPAGAPILPGPTAASGDGATAPALRWHAEPDDDDRSPWAAARREAPRWPDPHWDELPIALADGTRLRAVTAAAGRRRVRAGMTLAEARALSADLDVRPWDDAAIEREVLRATAALLVASPQVTPAAGAPGLWWVGASGFDGLGGERNLARTLLRVARLWHPRARVAIADSCVAARAATWSDEQDSPILILPRGGDATFLAAAPLALVPMDDELRETLLALGLRTAGAFAALRAEDVERRWGATGLAAWRLARGEDRRRPVLARTEARRAVSVELPAPAQTREPLLFLLRAALDRLVHALVRDGRAAASVAITLQLDDGRGALPAGGLPRTVTREARPARPLARLAPLFERCRLLLDAWRLDAPVIGLTVSIPATAPLGAEQGDLLAPAWRDPDALDAALERLRAELGPNVVVRPVARDTHRPEHAGAWEAVGQAPVGSPQSPVLSTQSSVPRTETRSVARCQQPATAGDRASSGTAPAAARLLDPPEPAAVTCDGNVPVALRWRDRSLAIHHATGPERLSGEWWKDGFHRDYWRCETAEGELVLFRDWGRGGSWWVQGWED